MTTPPPRYRAGDVERQQALAVLGDHFAEGRLDRDEFDKRSDTALRAVYLDELDALFVDLPVRPGGATAPGQRPLRGPSGSARHQPHPSGPRRPRLPVGVMLALAVLAVAMILATRGFAIWPLLAVWWFMASPCGGPRRSNGSVRRRSC